MMKAILTKSIVLIVLAFLACLVIDADVSAQEISVKKLIRKLDWTNASEAKAAYGELLLKGKKAAPYLIQSLSDPFENTSIRVNCADILGKLKLKETIPVLVEALTADQLRIRYTAAKALGNIGDSSALPGLIKALDDPDLTVKYHVITAIKDINDKSAGLALVRMLGDVNPAIRLLTAQALIDLDTKEAAAAFAGILEEGWDAKEIRQFAAKGLGNIGGGQAIEALSKAILKDRDDTVRAECADSLGKLGDKKAIPCLIKALDDEYKNVVLNSMASLTKITGKQLGFDPNRWREWYDGNKGI